MTKRERKADEAARSLPGLKRGRQFNVRFTAEEWETVSTLARDEGRTVAGMIRWLLKGYIDGKSKSKGRKK